MDVEVSCSSPHGRSILDVEDPIGVRDELFGGKGRNDHVSTRYNGSQPLAGLCRRHSHLDHQPVNLVDDEAHLDLHSSPVASPSEPTGYPAVGNLRPSSTGIRAASEQQSGRACDELATRLLCSRNLERSLRISLKHLFFPGLAEHSMSLNADAFHGIHHHQSAV